MPTLMGIVAIVFAMFFAVAAGFRQAAEQAPPQQTTTTLHFGPEVWLAVASFLITIGISLEQLRRARKDIADGTKAVANLDTKLETASTELNQKLDAHAADVVQRFAKLPDEYVRRDFWADKIRNVETGIERIDRRIDTILQKQ